MKLVSIGSIVLPVKSWSKKNQIPGKEFDYIDLSAIDKDSKSIVKEEIKRIDVIDAPSRAKQIVEQGDILVATVRPNLNAVAILENDNLLHTTASTGYCILRPDKSKVEKNYLFYWLRTNMFIKDMVRKSTGANYPAVSDKIIKESKIPLPPLSIQKKIVEILDKADALRKKTEQLLTYYDQLAESIFYEMFGETKTNEELSLVNIMEDVNGKPVFSNGPFGSDLLTSELKKEGVPVVYIRDIRNGYFDWKSDVYVTSEKAKSLTNCKVIKGDMLMTKVGDPPGTVAIYPNRYDAIITQDVIRFRLNSSIAMQDYIMYYFNSSIGQQKLAPIIIQGTRQRFPLKELKKLSIPIPCLSNQKEFSNKIKLINRLKIKTKNQLAEITNLYQSLLQKAFKGGSAFRELVNEETI